LASWPPSIVHPTAFLGTVSFKFRGDFFQYSATIAVSPTTPPETGHGFHFESDPATIVTNFAQFGTEHNGVFF